MKCVIIIKMFTSYSIIPLILPFFCFFNYVFLLSVFGKDYYKGEYLELNYIKKNHIIFSMLLQNISLI